MASEVEAARVRRPRMSAPHHVEVASSGVHLSPVLLRIGERVALCGVALLGGRERAPRSPRNQLLQALSRCLLTAGDTIPLVLTA